MVGGEAWRGNGSMSLCYSSLGLVDSFYSGRGSKGEKALHWLVENANQRRVPCSLPFGVSFSLLLTGRWRAREPSPPPLSVPLQISQNSFIMLNQPFLVSLKEAPICKNYKNQQV